MRSKISWQFDPPVLIELPLEPASQADMAGFEPAFRQIVRSHAATVVTFDQATGSALIGGQNETQLDDVLLDFKRSGFAYRAGPPSIAYRETISRKSQIDYSHKRHHAGSSEYARVCLAVEPLARGAGTSLGRKTGDPVHAPLFEAIEHGAFSVLDSGPLRGSPLIDIRITLIDISVHATDSSARAFELAARAALRDALDAAGPVLLEPVMQVEVQSLSMYRGVIVSDLNVRRGRVIASVEHGDAITVTALVPLANLFGYRHQLSSMSGGLATFSMTYSAYDMVNPSAGPDDFAPAIGMRA